MKAKYLNITFDPRQAQREAKKQFKRKFNLMVIRILFLISLTLILFGMLRPAASKATDPGTFKSLEKLEVAGGNRKFGIEGLQATEELISLETLVAEAGSTRTAEFVATAYCGCEKCCGKWASLREDGLVTGAAGVPLVEGMSVAVDNSIYKFGTEFTDQDGHKYVAADTGSAIVGNRIDVYFDDHEAARQFGKQTIMLSWEE